MRKLVGIGTGPGPSDLLTMRAIKYIKEADYIFAPETRGRTMALDTARPYLAGKEPILLSFPMGETTDETYREALEKIDGIIQEGEMGVYLNIGDSTIFSTFLNMTNNGTTSDLEIELVPGIPSFVLAANLVKENLVKKDEKLTILDCVDENTEFMSENYAILKAKNLEPTLNQLEASGYHYIYVENAGNPNQYILTDREEILGRNQYMSLLLARKKS